MFIHFNVAKLLSGSKYPAYGHNVKEVVGLYDIINVCLVYIENNKVRRDH